MNNDIMYNKRKYRPISLSESIIPELDKQLIEHDYHIQYNKENKQLQVVKSNVTLECLAEEYQEIKSPENTLENKEIILEDKKLEKKDYTAILMKKSLLFFTHLFLISLFEILFFNYFISGYEDLALNKLIISITQNLNNGCNNLNIQDKELIGYIFNNIVDINSLYNASQNAIVQREIYNKKLFNLAWYYFGGLLFLNILLISLNLYYKKAKLKKILIDNFIMICILGLYEYLFFSTIVLKYENMSTPEIENSFFNKINNCYIN